MSEAVSSDSNCMSGQPALAGHRLPLAHIVANIADSGFDEYIDDFDLRGEENKVKEAINYCRQEKCANAKSYCEGCSKNKDYPGEDLWRVASDLYGKINKKS